MIKGNLQSDAMEALKQGNHKVAGVLRMALAAITTKEKEKRYNISKSENDLTEEELAARSNLTDDEAIGVIFFEIKKRRDAVSLYEKGNRPELARKETEEIDILQKYLPEQLTEAELRKIIEESIQKVGAQSVKDMGKIMADLVPKIKSRAENSQASSIIRELIDK